MTKTAGWGGTWYRNAIVLPLNTEKHSDSTAKKLFWKGVTMLSCSA